MKIKAFPSAVNSGMELRDFFAGCAAQGLLSHPDCGDVGGEKGEPIVRYVALEAYRVADALMMERSK